MGRCLSSIASDTAELKFLRELRISEDGIEDGTILVANGAKNGKQLEHDKGVEIV